MINTICNYNCGIKQTRKRKFNSHFLLFCTKDAVRALYTALRNVLEQKIILIITNGTPLQYSCLENPMDGGAW